MSSLPTNFKSNNGGYLYVPHDEDFNFGNQDFTIEFWVKFNSWANDRGVISKGWPSNNGSFLIYIHNNSRLAFYASSNGSSWDIASSVSISDSVSINTWYHVAVTRNNNVYKTFINGVQKSTWNNSASLYNNSSHGLTIGNGHTGQHPSDCEIDGLRISKGVARYVSNFIPSTNNPLIVGSFKDYSRHSKKTANYGSVQISTSSHKFGGASAYLDGNSYLSVPGDTAWNFDTNDFTVEAWINPDSVNGTKSVVGNYDGADGGWRLAVGSPATGGTPNYGPEVTFEATDGGAEVDVIIPGVLEITRGSSQGIYNSAVEPYYDNMYYTSPANTSWNRCSQYATCYGSEVYCLDDMSNWNNICNYESRSYGAWRNYAVLRECNGGGAIVNMIGKELIMKHIPTNRYWAVKFTSWQQGGGGAFAYTRKEILGCSVDSSVIEFRNGDDTVIQQTVSPPLASGTWYHVAASRNSNSLKLFLDGNALGDSEVDVLYSNVSLLLQMNGSNASTSFVDRSSNPKTIAVNGNTQISTAQSKFGGTSAIFDGVGDYLQINNPPESIIRWFDTPYTVEFWVRPSAYGSSILGNAAANAQYWMLETNNDGQISFYYWTGSQNRVITTQSIPLDNWSHVALTQNDGLIKVYLNGVESASASVNSTPQISSSTYFNIGGTTGGFNGYLDDIRITRGGTPRYTGNFTPPTQSFPLQGPFTANINRINTNGITIGASKLSNNTVSNNYNGYIDDIRITKGLSRYSASFTAPVAPFATLGPAPTAPGIPLNIGVNERSNTFRIYFDPPVSNGNSNITGYLLQYSDNSGTSWNNASSETDPHYHNVSLLLPMNGENNSFRFYDDSKYNKNISVFGDAKITTEQGKFGGSSGSFDGTTDRLMVVGSADDSAFDLRNTDWTIDAWVRPTGNWGKFNIIVSKRGIGGAEGTEADFQLYFRQSSAVLCFYSGATGTIESNASPIPGIWNHVAAVRKGQTISLYLNGIKVMSFTGNVSYTTNRSLYIGAWPGGDEYFYGNMNDVRITKGFARYDSNFDPMLLTQAPANRIPNLTPNTSYTFRAKAQNSVGTGTESSTSTPVSVPATVTNLVVIPDSNQAYLSWVAPTENNSAIRDYLIEYSDDGGETWTIFNHTPSINTYIVVTGLTEPSYVFRVSAVNFAGAGQPSEVSSSTIMALREDNTYNKTRLLLHLDSTT
jgi:hypothetical protein